MMTFKQISFALAVLVGLATLAPAFALAEDVGGGATVNASVTAGTASVNASSTVRLGAAEDRAKGRGDQEVDRRITALNDLNARVQGMQKVSDAFKQSLNTNIQTEISALASLKGKIDADTDLPTLKTDIQSITKSYRVFMLVIPQGRIAAAADRIVAVVSMMSTLGAKLQARIQAAASAGNDVTALNTALQDISTKINDAQTQAQAAVTASATLTPDNGDKTVMASNDAALKKARADIVAGQKDLAAARKDVGTIISGLAKMKANTTATTTATTTP